MNSTPDINHSILEASLDGMMLCGPDGSIVYANRRMEEFFGAGSHLAATLEELFLRVPVLDATRSLHTLQKDLYAYMREPAAHAASFQRNFTYSLGTELHYYSLYAAPIASLSCSRQQDYLLVFRDRTEDEQRETLQEELISQISHELRTPLTSILGFSEILRNRELPTSSKQQKYVDTIYKEAVRLSRLVDDFLDLQRMESGNQRYYYVPVDMRELAGEASQQWNAKSQISLQLELEETDSVLVMADADRMKQVLHNLLSNAFKYSYEGTSVTLSVHRDRSLVFVNVKDEGLGIPDAEKAKIFRKFYRVEHPDRRKIPGSGLGLAIAKEIVEAHGGELTFTSRHGEGSTFTLWLPVYAPPAVAGRIILVERDDSYAVSLEAALTAQGESVLRLASFEEALLALSLEQEGPPRCIIADLVGRGLMNGLEFAAELLHHPEPSSREAPIFFLSAPDQMPDEPTSTRVGRAFMNKPFGAEQLAGWALAKMSEHNAAGMLRCAFPPQDMDALSAQLAKFGLPVAGLTEEQGYWIAQFNPPAIRLETDIHPDRNVLN
jgi:signal transduction histidine kinase/CheY-like chemotaxis protein